MCRHYDTEDPLHCGRFRTKCLHLSEPATVLQVHISSPQSARSLLVSVSSLKGHSTGNLNSLSTVPAIPMKGDELDIWQQLLKESIPVTEAAEHLNSIRWVRAAFCT